MNEDKLGRLWLLATFILVIIIIAGGILIYVSRDNGAPLVIESPRPDEFNGDISVDGAVNNPGIYPVRPGDSIKSILQASGGLSADADIARIHLYVPQTGTEGQPQKVDINKADVWLLQTLPGIGEVRANAIVEYRRTNGFFRTTAELTSVPGIGEATFEKLKDMVTIAAY